jgi:hypothetical protein
LVGKEVGESDGVLVGGDDLIKGIQPTIPESNVPIAAIPAITNVQNWMFLSQLQSSIGFGFFSQGRRQSKILDH